MEEESLKKLRKFYHSILNQQRLFDSLQHVDQYPTKILDLELKNFQKEFPGLLAPFILGEYYKGQRGNTQFYSVEGIRAYLGMAVGRLKVEIDEQSISPVTEKREFLFVKDAQLRMILERDYLEIQRGFIGECWKSVIILCGGAIEAVLTDLLKTNEPQAKASGKAPKNPDLSRWDLSDLINVAVELKLITPGVEKLSHPIREYRNLVHPGNEIRNKLTFNAEEARIALEVLNIVYRDLKT
jgi:hypothetical protein